MTFFFIDFAIWVIVRDILKKHIKESNFLRGYFICTDSSKFIQL